MKVDLQGEKTGKEWWSLYVSKHHKKHVNTLCGQISDSLSSRSRGTSHQYAGFIDFTLTFLTKALFQHKCYLVSGSVLPELTVLSKAYRLQW